MIAAVQALAHAPFVVFLVALAAAATGVVAAIEHGRRR